MMRIFVENFIKLLPLILPMFLILRLKRFKRLPAIFSAKSGGIPVKSFQELILQNIDDGVVLIDRNYRILSYNKAFQNIVGSDEDHKGKNLIDLLLPRDKVLFDSKLKSALNGFPARAEFRNHEDRVIESLIIPFFYKNKVKGAVLIMEDVTEIRKNQELLEITNEIIMNVPMVMAVFLPKFRIIRINPFTQRLLGLNTSYINASRWDEFIAEPDSRAEIKKFLWDIITNKKTKATRNIRIKAADGETKIIAFEFSIYFDEEGKIEYMLAVGKDYTDMVKMKYALSETEEKYRFIVENALDGVFMTDRNGVIKYVNKAVIEIFEYDSEKDFIGRNYLDFVAPSFKKFVKRKLIDEFDSISERFQFEFLGLCKAGGMKWINLKAKKTTIEGEEVVFGILCDVSKSKILLEQKQRIRILDTMSRLVSGIAHDFNNSLTGIMGYASHLMHTMASTAPERKIIGAILRSSQRAADTVAQLLSFSKSIRRELKPVNLNELVESSLENFAGMIPDNIKVVKEFTEDDIMIMGDEVGLHNCLLNFLVNAKDAMPDGGVITVKTAIEDVSDELLKTNIEARAGTFATVTISDTGIGMDEETMEHIFEPFFTTKKERGTGLGLAATYGIIKAHHGFITVDSKPKKGTTFTIYLPLSTVTEKAELTLEEGTAKHKGKEESNILVLEDDDVLCELFAVSLAEEGWKVSVAKTVEEAEELFEQMKVSIKFIISDISIGEGKSPIDWLSSIKKKYPHIKIICTSGMIDLPPSYKKCSDTFLRKPFTTKKLIEVIESVL